jgi:outer membrane protein OmpA-like peptidoglycan-associated protein
VATGAPETRNKIVSEGKWVSHGILFDVNSDRIKGESYGSLKEIANVLTTEFKIDAGRLETDGKGETQPIGKNDTPAGKANNRRVEFVRK